MRVSNLILLITVFSFSIFSCKKESNKTIDFKYGYFPTNVGHYVIYDVDSITFNSFYKPVRIDTVHFQIKEIIQSIFNDNTGAPTCRIEGFRRNTPNDLWSSQPYYVWTSNLYTNTAQKIEENLRYVKLVFPPSLTTTWSGNSYVNTPDTSSNAFLAGWTYSYKNIDVPLLLSSNSNYVSFDSSLTVLQDSNANLTNYTYSVEKYAKNTGLVYKQIANLAHNSQNLQDSIPWPQRTTDGFIYTMTAISFNK